MKGRIYKIYCKRPDVGKIYIGQTRERTLQIRWNKHKRDAEELLTKKRSKSDRGKAVKLHRAINNNSIDTMKIVELESYEFEDVNKLRNKLNQRENHFIDEFDTIKEGWNKIYASKILIPEGQDQEKTWNTFANEYDVDVRRLMHQVNNNNMNIDDAVERIRELDKQPKSQYSYGMQTYDLIKELLKYDKNKVGKKNLERRIRDLKNQKKLRVDLDKSKNLETIYLIEDIFSPVSQRDKIVKVNTPHGQEVGTITDLHEKLLPLYPDNVPDSYSTIQNRVDGKNFKVKWNHDQAFGFRFPPGFEEVENLIGNKGYQWGEIDGVQKNPSFKKDSKRITNPNPIILHSVKRIYLTEKDWCDAYKLNDRKKIKKLRDKGRTNEEILEYCGKKS